jgi:hypothetical protein
MLVKEVLEEALILMFNWHFGSWVAGEKCDFGL